MFVELLGTGFPLRSVHLILEISMLPPTAKTAPVLKIDTTPPGRLQRAAAEAMPAWAEIHFAERALYEEIQHQYTDLGVAFQGAIALQPSNPLFQGRSGKLVMAPKTNDRGITVQFRQSVRTVKVQVCSASPVQLAVFDCQGRCMSHVKGGRRYHLGPGTDLAVPLPHHELTLEGEAIARAVLTANTAFIVDRVAFGRSPSEAPQAA